MEILGIFASVLTIFAFMPQAHQVVITRKTRDVSLLTFSTLAITGSLWTAYGIGRDDWAIIITNTVITCLAIVIVTVKILDRD